MIDLFRIGLMRHAETVDNRAKRIQGQSESELTPEGVAMALAWGQSLLEYGFTSIVCSDLGRAQHTAQLVNESLGLPVRVDHRLREQDWGEWVGKSVRELRVFFKEQVEEQEQKGWEFRPPGGESRLEVLDRSKEAMVFAGLEAMRREEGKSLVIAHQGVLKCVLYDLMGMEFLPEERDPLEKYRLHLLSCDEQGLGLFALNNDL